MSVQKGRMYPDRHARIVHIKLSVLSTWLLGEKFFEISLVKLASRREQHLWVINEETKEQQQAGAAFKKERVELSFCQFSFFFNFKLFLNRSSSTAAGMRSIWEDNCIKRLLVLGCKKRHYMLQKNEATSEMALNALERHHKSIKNRQPLLQQKIKQLLKQLWTLWEYISHSCWKSINVSKFGCGFF